MWICKKHRSCCYAKNVLKCTFFLAQPHVAVGEDRGFYENSK